MIMLVVVKVDELEVVRDPRDPGGGFREVTGGGGVRGGGLN